MPTALRLVVGALSVALLGSSCVRDDSPIRTEGGYCTEVGNRLGDLNTTSFTTPGDITRVLDSWRAVGDTAPLAVEQEWEQVLEAMQLAADVDPADADSVQTMADTLREAQPAADRIINYTYRICGALIGGVAPVTTLPLQVPPTTTIG